MTSDSITILNEPMEVNWGDWLMAHPDCDTICEDVEVGERIRVFAFSKTSKGNKDLKAYRNEHLSGMQILKGISSYAIAGIV